MIYPDFPFDQIEGKLRFDEFDPRFFPGKPEHLIQFLPNKMQDFRNCVLHNCISNFDAEQVYLKLQVNNVKNKEVTSNPNPLTLEKNWSFKKPTLNIKP